MSATPIRKNLDTPSVPTNYPAFLVEESEVARLVDEL
jgi:hypothetical protein